MADLVCAACGGTNISRVEKGIDNRPLGVCRSCYPTLRKHYPLTPLMPSDQWRPKAAPVEAESVEMFG